MKSKKMIFGTIIFLLVITGLISISNAIDNPDYNVTIGAGEKFVVSSNLNVGEIVIIEYEISEGDADLDFYIVNSDEVVVENIGDVIGYGLYHFYVPYDDYFGIVFKNDRIFSHRHLQLNIDIIEVRSITITSPSIDFVYVFQSGYNTITWTSTGIVDTVQIQLYKNGIYLDMISSGTDNDGSYSWYIYDDEYIDDSDYQILVIDHYDNTIYDYSDYFTIECEIPEIEKTITISSPVSTSTFKSGYNTITWTSTGDMDYITIELYKNGVFLESFGWTDNDGSYSWYIYTDEYVDDSYYQIRISNYYDNSIYDFSSYFTMEVEQEVIPDEDNDEDPYIPDEDKQVIINILPIIIGIVLLIGLVVGIISYVIYRGKKHPKDAITKPEEKPIVKEIETPEIIYCRECGAKINKEKVFCSKCGTKQ